MNLVVEILHIIVPRCLLVIQLVIYIYNSGTSDKGPSEKRTTSLERKEFLIDIFRPLRFSVVG